MSIYLLQMWPHLIRGPALRLPAVEIAPLRTRIHHKVDRTATTKCSSTWHNRLAISQLWCFVALVEQRSLGCGEQILKIEHRVDDVWYIFVVCAAFDDENAEVGMRFGETAGDDATCCAAYDVWTQHRT